MSSSVPNLEILSDELLQVLDTVETSITNNTESVPSDTLLLIEDTIAALGAILPSQDNQQDVFRSIHQCFIELRSLCGQLSDTSVTANLEWLQPSELATLQHGRPEGVSSGKPGRPKLHIPSESLINLRQIGYSWNDVAKMLQVSRWTIHRRVTEYDLTSLSSFSDVSDEQLKEMIRQFISEHGNFVGFSMVYGHLESIGFHVQHRRVRNALASVDPCNSRLRWAMVVARRAYSVRSSNSLWHLDGHHSLVNWGFVTHGCIDGYSRLIIYLTCATNNRSETVVDLFQSGINSFGIPSRVRTDHGGENVGVWSLM